MNYRLLTLLLWPIFFIYTLKISWRDKSSRYFLQRLGFAYTKNNKKHIWIHCASVGEINTYMPLHIKLIEKNPLKEFIITTNTVTGANTLIKNISQYGLKQTQHCYLPIESAFAINRFIKAYSPSQCLIMETEIWPLLYRHCHNFGVSISIINGRLSQRTLNTNYWIKSVYKNSLLSVKHIICKSQDELKHFLILGARPEQCLVGGNLKFTSISHTKTIHAIKINGKKYVVVASTHHDEELQLATLWKKINTDLILVIVPRHPNRSAQIQKQLDTLKIQYSVRSKKQTIFNDTKIYLADTLGELTQLMQGAELVIIGGSFIQHGGQNILEPCRLGKPTICGPHMYNFKEEMEFLHKNRACLQVNNLNELETAMADFIHHPQKFITMGNNAKTALQKQSAILDCYLSIILDEPNKY